MPAKNNSGSGQKLAAAFEDYIDDRLGGKARPVALLLSSGMDSTVLGVAAHRIGCRVHAYTFQVGDAESFDVRKAKNTAKLMGWQHDVVRCPVTSSALLQAWPVMHRTLQCRSKTQFECTWPFLYVYPAIREKYILNGLMLGSYCALNRSAAKLGLADRDSPLTDLQRWRREIFLPLILHGSRSLNSTYNPSSIWQHLRMQAALGLVNVSPALSQEVYNLLYRRTWVDVNKPRQKQAFEDAYPEEIRLVGHHNRRSYQSQGVTAHFQNMALGLPVNYRRRKRVIDMIRHDWGHRAPEEETDRVIAQIVHTYKRPLELGKFLAANSWRNK